MMTPNCNITVSLTPEIRLNKALKQALMDSGIKNVESVTRLSIAGTVTDNDIRCIDYIRKNLSTNLQELDLSNVSFEELDLEDGWVIIGEMCKPMSSVSLPGWFLDRYLTYMVENWDFGQFEE
jgi:hypothetical protein